VIGVLVFGAMGYAVFKFRKSKGAVASQFSHNTTAEVIWTVIPALILATIAVPTVRTVFDLTECAPDSMRIEVIAHQWWFGLVGSDQVTHPWLDEALTQYSTMLYYERAYSAERAARIRYVEFEQVHQGLIRRGRDLPIGLPADEYAPGLYWDVVYDKGALYFHALRERTGDDAFFRILRTYYERHRYGIATPETFLDAVETVTGDRHMDLFAEWVLGDPTDR